MYYFEIGQFAVVEFLLNHEANPNIKDSNGDTALIVAPSLNGNKLKDTSGFKYFRI